MIELDKFHLFYEENKDKLMIKESGKYPIDNNKFSTWIERQLPNDKILAQLLRKYTKYIPFSEFYQKIEQISADIGVLIDTYKPKNVVLLILGMNWDEPIKKSPMWVGLLYYGLLQKSYKESPTGDRSFQKSYKESPTITHIMTDTRDVLQLAEKEKTMCIISEDTSYTGSQLISFIGKNFKIVSPVKENIEFIIGTPYISKKAKKRLISTLHKCYFSPVTEIFNSIKDNIDGEPSLVSEGAKLSEGYSNIRNNYTIYFDHKLADSYSIIQHIYSFGDNLSSSEELSPITLIKNCDYSKLNYKELMAQSDIQKIVGASKMCPPPMYKLIDYKYKDKSVSSIGELM